MIQPLFVFYDWALLALRVVLGVILVVRGIPKLKGLRAARGADAAGRKPRACGTAVAGTIECAGGLLIAVGFLTQLAALLVLIRSLAVALGARRAGGPSGSSWLNLLIAAAALLLMTTGGGLWSIEQASGTFILY